MAVMDTTLRVTIDGEPPTVVELDPAELDLDGGDPGALVEIIATSASEARAGIRRFRVVIDGWAFTATVESARLAGLRERASRGASASSAHVSQHIRAQIPGRVVRVWVAAGDRVELGQRLLAIEAMKMENEVRATRAGVVEAVAVAVGETVELGDELITVG